MTLRRLRPVAVIAAVLVAAPLVVGAAPAPRPAGFCDSFLSFLCPKPDPTPEQTPAPDDGQSPAPETSDPDDGSAPDEEAAPEDEPGAQDGDESEQPVDPAETESVEAQVDDAAPVFTGTPASMRSQGLSFSGLRGISIVRVPTVDGSDVRALKISADSITIAGFSLSVRPHEEPGLVTTADTMSLEGSVSVYLGSVSASVMGGEPLTLGTDTPPSLDEIEPGLVDVTMGLIGSTADSISYSNTDQNIVLP
ncbi:hypothetical protein HD600_000078 [Microbacterium ginsengiterrae]|uniref:Uncharacterized protein n=1 Tax=Microbacterium ginsengiterrae TaxID=546115 RepID=A0A7W9F9U7_9MICO|nr:hypothetical protein [Microbacterium ginsengiterrae]MBB5741581.1 hypothetical protein [Microbacterium ginsengiterrae]